MHVWLVKLEEQLPIDEGFRPYRMGMLADALVKKGHRVTRWCSDLEHLRGKNRFGCRKSIIINNKYSAELLHSGIRYKQATSILRLLDNILLYRQFMRDAMRHKDKPDLIVCSMPTPELAYASAKIAKSLKIPLVLDARDMWPDILESELSGLKKILALPVIWWMKQKLTYAATNANSLVGITSFYRDHLLRYANRKESQLDAVFSLGYAPNENEKKASSEELIQYWRDLGVDTEGSKKIIYFAGRLNSTVYNAIDPIVRVAKELGKNRDDVLFVLCGTGTKSSDIISKFVGLDNVVLPGEVKADDLAFLRGRSFVAILPIEPRVDYLNSLSNKFFEYLSSALPVLSWIDGLPGKTLKENKCGYVYNSAEDLLSKIMLLLDSPDLVTSMRVNALDLFNRKYRSDIVYGRFVEHLENVAVASSL
jgi:glycosyltransferase involved in cell wall biosynthesis